MLSLPSNQSANHAILTFQPTPSIQFLQQYKISDPMDAYKKNLFSSSDGKNPRNNVLSPFCVLSEWSYVRESSAFYSAAKFSPPKMPVPPSGPSNKHNSVPKLRFIPATVVYGSKRHVPSGANSLHN
ncbi:hypothetical protein Hanom_Chr14g01322691 [Helianthus anomalus]